MVDRTADDVRQEPRPLGWLFRQPHVGPSPAPIDEQLAAADARADR